MVSRDDAGICTVGTGQQRTAQVLNDRPLVIRGPIVRASKEVLNAQTACVSMMLTSNNQAYAQRAEMQYRPDDFYTESMRKRQASLPVPTMNVFQLQFMVLSNNITQNTVNIETRITPTRANALGLTEVHNKLTSLPNDLATGDLTNEERALLEEQIKNLETREEDMLIKAHRSDVAQYWDVSAVSQLLFPDIAPESRTCIRCWFADLRCCGKFWRTSAKSFNKWRGSKAIDVIDQNIRRLIEVANLTHDEMQANFIQIAADCRDLQRALTVGADLAYELASVSSPLFQYQ